MGFDVANKQSFSIQVERCEYTWVEKDIGIVPLQSEFWCLYYHDQVTAAFDYNGQRIIAEPNWFYLIAPHTECTATLLASSHQLVHFFTISEFIHSNRTGIFKLPAAHFATESIFTLINMDNNERQSTKGQMYSYFVINYALTSLDKLLSKGVQLDVRIQSAITHINASYHSKISIGELAGKYHMTRESFSRLFKKETGETPYQLFTRLRINKAKLLLLNKSYTVGQVGNIIGYSDQYHFSRLFKQWTGESPSEYRRKSLS